MSGPLAETKCPSCGGAAQSMGSCPYCGTFVPLIEKASDGVGEVRVATPGQRDVVLFLKAQHERVKGHTGYGCLFVAVVGCGGPFVAWWLGSLPVALGLLVTGCVLGIVLAMREEQWLCERDVVPRLRERMAEAGVDRSTLLQLANATLPKDSRLLHAIVALI